jgi:phospholipid-binding lipoprotein MlaA
MIQKRLLAVLCLVMFSLASPLVSFAANANTPDLISDKDSGNGEDWGGAPPWDEDTGNGGDWGDAPPWDDDTGSGGDWDDAPPWDENTDIDAAIGSIADPLEPMNRAFYRFNDKMYVWVLDPVARGYAKVIPVGLRTGINAFFENLYSPVRMVNALLQGDIDKSGIILGRFVINTTAGVLGLADVADQEFGLKKQRADFGQTLGVWGVGNGFYLYWPLIGPSSVRDTVGYSVDGFSRPTFWLIDDWLISGELVTADNLNFLSLNPGFYDEFRKMSFDPYIATRQAYFDYRNALIRQGKAGIND